MPVHEYTKLHSQIISMHRPFFESPNVEFTCWYSPVDSCYCEAGFSLRSLGGSYIFPALSFSLNKALPFTDHIITFTRDGSEDYGCNVYE